MQNKNNQPTDESQKRLQLSIHLNFKCNIENRQSACNYDHTAFQFNWKNIVQKTGIIISTNAVEKQTHLVIL